MRLDKFICKSTEFSKVDVQEIILDRCVTVNGDTVTDIGMQVHENNQILLNGLELKCRDFRYIIMNKPANTICSNIDEHYPSLFNYLEIDKVSELHIAGRLDADTTGMVLITDDGRWSFNITSPSAKCKKVYRVGLSRNVDEKLISEFKSGIQLQGEQGLTSPAHLEIVSNKEVLLTITEGKFYQVKRMFTAVGNRVVSLHREQIGIVSLDIEVGLWRYLTEDEVSSLRYEVSSS